MARCTGIILWARHLAKFLLILVGNLSREALCTSAANGTSLIDSNSTSAPQIRIAMLFPAEMVITPLRYMMKYFDVPERKLLPDFNVIIDTYTISLDSGEAPSALAEILSDDTPVYHAIAGPLGRQDSMDIVDIVAKWRILNVHAASNVALNDRTRYPYTFRTTRSTQGDQSVMYYICWIHQWHSVISVWEEQDMWDGSNMAAEKKNITNYPILSEHGVAQWIVDNWQNHVVSLVRFARIRVVVVFTRVQTGWQLLCRIHQAMLSGLQYFGQGRWGVGWYLQEPPDGLGLCSPDEMYVAAGHYLTVSHTTFSPGLSLMGQVTYPTGPYGDQSKLPLTCMPNLTAHDFYNSGEQLTMALDDGWFPDISRILLYFGFAGPITDVACALIVALHNAIYHGGVPISSIESRDRQAFHDVVEAMSRISLQSSTGPFGFYSGTGDPEYIYHMVAQGAVPGKPNLTNNLSYVIVWPAGPDEDPLLQHQEGSWPLVWRDGSTGLDPKPHLALFPDCGLSNSVLIWDKCVPCPPGTAYDAALQSCRTCPLGQYQNKSGTDSCFTALPGWYVFDKDTPTAASPCPAGYECPQPGMVTPQPCRAGRYANQTGQAECLLCGVGEYQSETAQSECVHCATQLLGGITENIASMSADQCICPGGTYRPVDGAACLPCPEGMDCPEGSDMRNLVVSQEPYPQAQRGFMTLPAAPLTVYKCEQEQHCPGGPPGSCASYRDSSVVACGDCTDGAYQSGEDCKKCGGSQTLPFFGACLAAVVLVALAALIINRDMHKTTAASLMIVVVGGLLFTSLQALGVFASMEVPWEEPIKSLLSVAQLLSFDLELLQAACVMGTDPLRSFTVRQTVALAAIPVIWMSLLLKKYMPKHGRPNTSIKVELCNSIGTLYSVFYISIIISAVDPFICYEHPGSNGESVRSMPSLLCFEGGRHTAMIFIGVIALCMVPLPFWCLCVYGVWMYPKRINSHNSRDFLHAMRFLFFRYVPRRYYYQLIVLLRSMFLCLVPPVFSGQPATQIIFLCLILSTYVIVAEELQPWRSWLCNPLDATLSQLLVMMMLCGTLYLEETPGSDITTVLGSFIIALMAVSTFSVVAYALWKRFRPGQRYHFFICHHKGHAAAQARYLKSVLQMKRRNVRVFIDSDNLQELDSLFDIVKAKVRHLVVYLTGETLKRPWCAGEIVTALRSKLLVTKVRTPSFVAPTEELLAALDSYIESDGCNLSEYGIQWSDIHEAFILLLSTSVPQVELNVSLPGTRRLQHVVDLLLQQGPSSSDDRATRLSGATRDGVIVSTLADSDEASAAGGILVSCIAQDVYRVCEQGITLLCDYHQDAEMTLPLLGKSAVVVVMLTPGCLQSVDQVGIICESVRLQGTPAAPTVISVNTPGFQFPSAVVIDSLCVAMPSLEKSYPNAAEDVRMFFKRISILFPTHASQQTLETHAGEVFRRIQAHFKGKAGHGSSFPGHGQAGGSMLPFSPVGSTGQAKTLSSGSGPKVRAGSPAGTQAFTDDDNNNISTSPLGKGPPPGVYGAGVNQDNSLPYGSTEKLVRNYLASPTENWAEFV